MGISAKFAVLLLLVCSCSALQDCPLQTDFELAVCVPLLQCEIYLSLRLPLQVVCCTVALESPACVEIEAVTGRQEAWVECLKEVMLQVGYQH